jgi:serine/threonine-protein kinase
MPGDTAPRRSCDSAEAAAAGRLDHPGIVSIYEVGEVGGQHFLSMAYVDGPQLVGELQAGPFNRRAAQMIRDVAAQCSSPTTTVSSTAISSRTIIDSTEHRELPTLALRRISDDAGLTTTGQIMGTPAYMSPEQRQVARPMQHQTSIHWSDAASPTARPPFQAATSVETLRQVVEVEPVSPGQSCVPRTAVVPEMPEKITGALRNGGRTAADLEVGERTHPGTSRERRRECALVPTIYW